MIPSKRPVYVLDASVVLKWFSGKDEKDLQNAIQMREAFRQRNIDLLAPELLIYEVANVLRFKKGMPDRMILNSVDSLFRMRLLKSVNPDIMEDAIELAIEYDITVYDSTYLSLARYLNCPMITADEKLFNKIKPLPDVILLKNF